MDLVISKLSFGLGGGWGTIRFIIDWGIYMFPAISTYGIDCFSMVIEPVMGVNKFTP